MNEGKGERNPLKIMNETGSAVQKDHRKNQVKQEAATPSEEDISALTSRLLTAANNLGGRGAYPGRSEAEDRLFSDFLSIYREWIILEHAMPGSRDERTERAQLALHVMASAATLGEALELLVRFTGLLQGNRGLTSVEEVGDRVKLNFHYPTRPGPAGEISCLWPLCLTLCELEFLAGGILKGVSAKLPHASSLPPHVAGFLFDRPLVHGTGNLSLILPREHMRRPVIVKGEDIAAFFRSLLPNAFGERAELTQMGAIVSTLIRNERRRSTETRIDLDRVSALLGCSRATVRRRLAAEKTSFRRVKDEALDQLAKSWLEDSNRSIESIAEDLGYSDCFAFRRAFRRSNGCSPTEYRRKELEADAAAT